MGMLDEVFQRKAVFVSDGELAYIRYWSDSGELWVFGGAIGNRQEIMRAVGREAADLESGFTWHDAAIVSEAIRESWPTDDSLLCLCQCAACRQRRDRDAEVAAMKEAELPRAAPVPLKAVPLWRLFFEWLLWGGK